METFFNQLPTPLEILLDPISLIVLGIYASMMIWEAIFPARPLPKIKNWKLRGLLSFFFFFYLSSYLPLMWDEYLAGYQVFNLTGLGTWGGAAVGILVYELGLYLWHYSIHKSDFLWRVFHQMHHSAERMDSYGAFYFSPMDMIGFTFLGSVCLVVVAGFTPEASTVILLGTVFLGIFQHSNIATPQWLGYLIQRPESHTVHHAKGIHAYNYSDLPIFDILFGTFKNPPKYENETGFYDGASARVRDMIFFRDVSSAETTKTRQSISSETL
ncbi:MAG: sterol desaturase family protein [Leeuwenhoekiella sp.]